MGVFDGIAAGGFAEGFDRAAGRDLQERALGLQESQIAAQEQQRTIDAIQGAFANNVKVAAEGVEALNLKIAATPEGPQRDTLVQQKNEWIDRWQNESAKLAATAQASGLPINVNSAMAPLETLRLQPSIEQQQAVKATGQGLTSQAQEAGKLTAQRQFETPLDERLEEIRLEAMARARGAVAGGGGPKAPVTIIKNFQNTGEPARIKKAGEVIGTSQGERVAQAFTAADDAQATLVQNANMRRAIRDLQNAGGDTGALAPMFSRMKAILASAGVDLAKFGIDENTVANEQAIQSMTVGFALDNVEKTSGPISDAEMALFMQASPGLAKTSGGNMKLLELSDRAAKRKIAYARFINDKLQENNGDPGGLRSWTEEFQDANPFFTEAETQAMSELAEDPAVLAHPQAGILSESIIEEKMQESGWSRQRVLDEARKAGFR